MRTFVISRLLVLLVTLLGASVVIFLIMRLIPGDPVLIIMNDYFVQESYDSLHDQLGLNRPLPMQYASFVWKAIQGDLGASFKNRRPVTASIRAQLPYTAQLGLASLLIAVVVAIPIGLFAAINRGRWPDLASMFGALVAASSPEFLLGIGLLLAFSVRLNLFPSFGAGEAGNWVDVLRHLALPALALGGREAALLARITRSTVLSVLSQEYVRTARAKGLAERTVLHRHALRNALIPIVTVIGVDLTYLLGGTVVIETVFSRQGLGRLLVDAILTRDYPLVQGTLLMFIVVAVVVNTAVDLLYGWLDPRIKYS